MMNQSKARRLGKYYLLDVIGIGGMAEIYRAQTFDEAGNPQLVAIKRLLPSAMNEDLIRMLIDEARIATLIEHPSVARVYAFWQIQDEYILVMEYVDGKDLRTVLEKHRRVKRFMRPEDAAYIAIKVLEGLHAAHTQLDRNGNPLNLVHRDVSPSNILISYEGEVKLCDFGIAKASLSSTKTKAGIVKGKAKYMSPEQAMGKKLDARSDIFSMGIVLYEMLTLVPPFLAATEVEMLMKVRDGKFIPVRTRNPAIPPMLQRIVHKALSKDLNKRYQNALEFASALREFLNIHSPSYTDSDLAKIMGNLFSTEKEDERKRLEQFGVLENTQNLPREGVDLIREDPNFTTSQNLATDALEDPEIQPVVPEINDVDIYTSATVLLGDDDSDNYQMIMEPPIPPSADIPQDTLDAPTEILVESTSSDTESTLQKDLNEPTALSSAPDSDYEDKNPLNILEKTTSLHPLTRDTGTETDGAPVDTSPTEVPPYPPDEKLPEKMPTQTEHPAYPEPPYDGEVPWEPELLEAETHILSAEEAEELFNSTSSESTEHDEFSQTDASGSPDKKPSSRQIMREIMKSLHIGEDTGDITSESEPVEEEPNPFAAALSPGEEISADKQEDKHLTSDETDDFYEVSDDDIILEDERTILEDGGLSLTDSSGEEDEEGQEEDGDFVMVLTQDMPIMPVNREHPPVVLGEINIDSQNDSDD